MTKITNCVCKHTGQDGLHGVGNRVHNTVLKPPAPKGSVNARCTVCGTVKTVKE